MKLLCPVFYNMHDPEKNRTPDAAGAGGRIAVALGLVALAQGSAFFRRDVEAPGGTDRGPSRAAIYLAPLLSIVAAAMIGGAFSTGGLDRLYPNRLAAVACPCGFIAATMPPCGGPARGRPSRWARSSS
jgi:hypothetical protein